MALSSELFEVSYNGDGSQTAFPIPFVFLQNSHITAVLRDAAGVETTWTEGIQYTLSGGAGSTGTLTATTAPTSGETLKITRVLPLTQSTDYPIGGPFPADTVEQDFDQARMVDQQQQEQIDRAIKFPITDLASVAREFPVSSTRANKIPAFGGSGEVTLSTKTLAQIEAAVDSVTSGSAVTDAASVTYTPAGTGAVDRNVRDVLRQGVSVLDFIPVVEHAAIRAGTSTYDAYADFVAADAAAASSKTFVFIPPGTYRLNSDFKHIDGDEALASWRGAGPDKTVLQFNVTTADPRLLTYASAPNHPERLDTVTPASDLAQLNPQTALGHLVTLTTPVADAAKFAVGDWVYVSSGIDIYDADGELWRFTMITRIVELDAGTGNIILADPIEEELIDDGWSPGSAKNTAPDWANTTAYTAGDYVYGDTTALWQAQTSGVSSGTGPADDTGVTWNQLTTNMGALKGNRDGRPVIQKVLRPSVGVSVSDLTIENVSSTVAGGHFDLRSVYNGGAENVWLRGKTSVAFGSSESSHHARFRDVIDQTEKELAHQRSFGSYAARDVVLTRCQLFGSNSVNTRFPAFLEANTVVHFDHCRFSQQQGENTWAIFMSSAHVSAVGCSFHGVAGPVSASIGLAGVKPDRPDLSMLADVRGWQANFSDIIPEAFRRLWPGGNPGQNLQVFGPGNTFRIYNNFAGGYSQTDPLMFRPNRLVPYTVSFTPAVSQTGTVITLPSTPQDGILDITDIRAVLLGAKVRWVTPAANSVSVDIFMSNGVTNRRALSLTKANNLISVDSSNSKAQKFDGDGNTERLIDNTPGVDERIRIQYDSGAAAGGTVYVTLFLLIDDGADGDGGL